MAGADDTPQHRYTAALAGQIETRWQAYWEKHQTFRAKNPGEPGFDAARPKFYCLDMFPYPSGDGLHVGHPEGYTATDIYSRFMRMRGHAVLHPMGWDAFGLPAEQYALATGVHPAITTRKAIETFRRQLKRFGFSYDWSREIATIEPAYYRWTQWIFLKLYNSWYDARARKARPIAELTEMLERGRLNIGVSGELVGADRGDNPITGSDVGVRAWHQLSPDERRATIDDQRLAYIDEVSVNWCPKLGTALANEEVIDGKSERGGFPVSKKPLRQWMLRITAYADRLLEDLATVQWPDSTRTMQTEWIGRSNGAEIDFPIEGETGAVVRVFTTRPDTIFGATYMVVAPEHPLIERLLSAAPATKAAAARRYVDEARDRGEVERQAEGKDKTGVDTGRRAINPATGQAIPIWVADYVLMGYGHGAIMGVPGHDARDHEFASRFGLPIRAVVRPPEGAKPPDNKPFEADGIACNSSGAGLTLDGLPTAQAKQKTIEWVQRQGLGRGTVNYRLRDWLFSRQRYWGEPFPIVYDAAGHHYPVSEAALPVRLPDLADYQPEESDEPRPLLAKAGAWLRTTAGQAGVDPSVLPPNTPVTREANTMPNWAGSCWYYLRFCDPAASNAPIGADAERYWMGRHGVDLYVGGAEHAVLHLLYARFWHKALYDLGFVSTPEPAQRLFHQGMITSFAYQRPDKSLVPADQVEEKSEGRFVEKATGAPVTQIVAKMSKSLKNVINPDDVIAEFGADTFRLYEMYMGPLDASKPWNPRDITGLFRFLQRAWRLAIDEQSGTPRLAALADPAIERLLHRTIAKVGRDIERLAFNTAIAALIELVNAATGPGMTADQLSRFTLTLAPFAPHMAEEIWARLGNPAPVSTARWPAYDEAMLRDESVQMPVQIQGKVRGHITVAAGADAKTIEAAALAEPRVRELVQGRPIKKVIVVPGKLVNIVQG